MAPSQKTMLFVCLLVVVVAVVVPVAQGQIVPGLGPILGPIIGPIAPILGPIAPILGPIIGPITPITNPIRGLVNISGLVLCSVNASATVGTGGVTIPPFSNATVNLVCGPGNGTVVGVSITNLLGQYTILLPVTNLSSLLTLVTNLLSGCRIVVATPLASCNATLPAVGNLTASLLSDVFTVVNGLLTANILPGNLTFNLGG